MSNTQESPDTASPEMPIVRLTPKGDARAIRHGFPWVYANELVLDRRTKKIAAGTIARLQDAERRDLGTVAMNPGSKIICRMLDRDPNAVIDQAWLAARLQRALAHRNTLFSAPFYRLVHAEADGLCAGARRVFTCWRFWPCGAREWCGRGAVRRWVCACACIGGRGGCGDGRDRQVCHTQRRCL